MPVKHDERSERQEFGEVRLHPQSPTSRDRRGTPVTLILQIPLITQIVALHNI